MSWLHFPFPNIGQLAFSFWISSWLLSGQEMLYAEANQIYSNWRNKGAALELQILFWCRGEMPLVSSPIWFHDGIPLSSQRIDPRDKTALSLAKEASVGFPEGKGDLCEANNEEDKKDGKMAGESGAVYGSHFVLSPILSPLHNLIHYLHLTNKETEAEVGCVTC